MSYERFQSCIKACNECATECERCSNACLKQEDVKKFAHCIQLTKDCIDICILVSGLMARNSEFAQKICILCAEICQACGDECKKHSQMEHCKRCADTCYHCAQECRNMAKIA